MEKERIKLKFQHSHYLFSPFKCDTTACMLRCNNDKCWHKWAPQTNDQTNCTNALFFKIALVSVGVSLSLALLQTLLGPFERQNRSSICHTEFRWVNARTSNTNHKNTQVEEKQFAAHRRRTVHGFSLMPRDFTCSQ